MRFHAFVSLHAGVLLAALVFAVPATGQQREESPPQGQMPAPTEGQEQDESAKAHVEVGEGTAGSQERQAAPASAPGSVVPPQTVESAPPPPQPQAAPTAADESVAPYVIMGVGGAMVVAGIATGIVANSKVNAIEDHCPMDRCPRSYDLEVARDRATVLVSVTDALLIGGLVTAGIGAVLALVAEKDSSATLADAVPEPAAALACGPHGCSMELRGRF